MIIFNNIKIKNFRGISELNLDKFKQFNIIVGNNDAGKTSVLEALYININPGNPHLPLTANAHRGIVSLENLQFWKSLFRNYETKEAIEFEASILEKHSSKIKILPNVVPTSLVKESLTLNTSNQTTSADQTIRGLKTEFSYDVTPGAPKSYSSEVLLNQNDPQNPLTTKLDINWKQILDGFFLSIQNTYGTDLAARVGELITLKQEKELIGVLHEIDPRIKDINLDGSSRVLIDIEGINQRILINSLGEGLYRIANIISLILRASNGVVLIDEIETGLDRRSQKKLWKAIFKAATKSKVQIFATTHSLETIDTLYDILTEEKAESNMSLTRLERKSDQSITPVYFDYEQLQFSRNQGWEIR